MINSSWGGTAIEPWTSLDALRGTTSARQRVIAFEKSRADYEANKVKFNQMRDEAIKKQADAMAEWTGSIFTNDSERQSRRPNIPIPSIPGSGVDVSTIYNAMIAPLAPYALRGAIWYQGESNAEQPLQYAELLPAMISSWRKTWGQKDFDFLFVQLSNYMARQKAPIETQSWADIRDSQRLTLADPHAGMAVAIDIGEATDIHPRNKQDVGKRLALWALARTYGKKGFEYSGPLYRSVKIKDNRAIVTFDHVGAGLASRGTPLVGFAVAGEDKIFHVAKATIDGETVVVSSDSVAKPVAVRYAWANNPICNLYNKDGLPASSFRTDTWSSSEIKAASESLSEPMPAAGPSVK